MEKKFSWKLLYKNGKGSKLGFPSKCPQRQTFYTFFVLTFTLISQSGTGVKLAQHKRRIQIISRNVWVCGCVDIISGPVQTSAATQDQNKPTRGTIHKKETRSFIYPGRFLWNVFGI